MPRKTNISGDDLPKDFLNQIVSSENGDIPNLCRTCHCVPICTVFQESLLAYEKFGVGKVVVECPHYISNEDVAKIDEEPDSEDKE